MNENEKENRQTEGTETNLTDVTNLNETTIEAETDEEDDAVPATFATVKLFSDKKKNAGRIIPDRKEIQKNAENEPSEQDVTASEPAEAAEETDAPEGAAASAETGSEGSSNTTSGASASAVSKARPQPKPPTRPAIFSGFTLKMIAVITMLIDHTAVALLSGTWTEKSFGDPLYAFYFVLRLIGRFAFPIFCFLLVEGFFHTRSRLKYAIRLAVFAIVSELPFDLALSESSMSVRDRLLNFGSQNVFFTLLIGFLVIWSIEWWMSPWLKQKKAPKSFSEISKFFLPILGFILVGALAAFAVKCDYSLGGVVAIVFIYFAHGERHPGMNMVRSGLILAITGSAYTELIVPAGFPLTEFYSGQRGRNWKWFFYVFYPAHLLLLFLLRWLI